MRGGQRHRAPLPSLAPVPTKCESLHLWTLSVLGGPHPQGPDKLRDFGGWRKSAKRSARVQRQKCEHPPCFRPSLQLCQATNQGRQLWGRARGRGALTASSGLGLGGCGQGPARRKREEASGKSGACGQGQPQRCSAGLEDIEQMRPRPSSPGQEAGGAGWDEGGGRQDAWGCRTRGPGERARETGTRAAPGWRREQAERKPGQGQRGKRQGADEIQEEEEVDEDEAGPPAGSGGGGGGGGREKRLAGS